MIVSVTFLEGAFCPLEDPMSLLPYRDLLCVPHGNNTDFNGAGSKLDLWKTATEQRKY